MGLFIGFLYWQTTLDKIGISNLNGAMFYIVAELTYSTLFGIVTFLPGDFPLLVREYHDGLYNSGAYFVARAASYVPLFAVDGLILVATAYWMTGLVPTMFRFCIALGKLIKHMKPKNNTDLFRQFIHRIKPKIMTNLLVINKKYFIFRHCRPNRTIGCVFWRYAFHRLPILPNCNFCCRPNPHHSFPDRWPLCKCR